MPPSELRHRAAGETDTCEVSVHYLSAHDVLLAGTGNIRFPVWQACCHDVPRIYMAMIFLVCWEKSWFLETWSKTLKQRASPAVVFYRNFKTEVKVRICSEPPEEPGKEIQRKPKGGWGGQIPLHSYQKTEVWDTQKLWRWHAIMSSFPGDRKASWGSRSVKDWASVLSPTSFSTQAGTYNLLMQELSQRSDVLSIEQLSNQKTEFMM